MSDNKHIIQSLAVNATIAVAKTGGAVLTGSGALLAEAIHSWGDCTNQVLLLVGVRAAAKPADESHPLGYGRALYFWSFIVALLLFSGGGVFSVYEGIHKLLNPEPVEHVAFGFGILGFSLCLEGWATWGNLKEMKQRRGSLGLVAYLKATKDSDLVLIFGENAAAVLGLGFALVALGLATVTGDSRFDAAGSLFIGLVLIGVAIFLGFEVASLLLGERADPGIEAAVREAAAAQPELAGVLTLMTVQQGPAQVMVAVKVRLQEGLSVPQVVEAINAFERTIKAKAPDVKWCFVEPDDVA